MQGLQTKIALWGIDPAFRKDGFAACIGDLTDRTVRPKRFKSFLDFVLWVPEQKAALIQAGYALVICVENSNLDQIMYAYHRTKKGQALASAARNVGANQAASQYTVDYLRSQFHDFQVIEISPSAKGRKWDTYREANLHAEAAGLILTGFKGTASEQDERDALKMLITAKSFVPTVLHQLNKVKTKTVECNEQR